MAQTTIVTILPPSPPMAPALRGGVPNENVFAYIAPWAWVLSRSGGRFPTWDNRRGRRQKNSSHTPGDPQGVGGYKFDPFRKAYGGEKQMVLAPGGDHHSQRPVSVVARALLFLVRAFRKESNRMVVRWSLM